MKGMMEARAAWLTRRLSNAISPSNLSQKSRRFASTTNGASLIPSAANSWRYEQRSHVASYACYIPHGRLFHCSEVSKSSRSIKSKPGKINPIVDIAFKKIFGVEENKDLLISLINSILGEDDQVAGITLLNPHNSQSFTLDKESILDIKAVGLDGKN